MGNQYIKVIVSGLSGSGKTTIANLIADTLESRGFDIIIEADEEGTGNRTDRIQSIINKGIEVHIEEKDANRGPKHGYVRQPQESPRRGRPIREERPKDQWFSGVDENVECISCNQIFVFTVGEQEFFKDNGLDRMPRRCRPCRHAKKQARG